MTHQSGTMEPAAGISRDEVVTAALEIGIDSFTMGKVARRLGVHPRDLERTVSSRDDVVVACLERATADLRLPRAGLDWPDHLRYLADSIWTMLEAHPGLDHTLIDVPWAYVPFMPAAKRSHTALVEAGLRREDAYLALSYLADTVLTAHRSATAMRSPEPTGERGIDAATRMWDERFGQGGASFGLEGRSGHRGEAEPVPFRPEESWVDAASLGSKIEVLIEGLRALSTVVTADTSQAAVGYESAAPTDASTEETESPMKTLVLVFHPDLSTSRVNKALAARAQALGGDITVRYMYELYPDFNIDVAAEQEALMEADRIVLQFPMYWLSCPPLLKKWEDDVWTYGWAYGSEGTALHGKELLLAISVGGNASAYGRDGVHVYTVHEFLRPFQGSSRVIGTKFMVPFLSMGALEITDEAIAQRAEDYAAVLSSAKLPALELFG
ncbi:NAD(P)H-dependent oxidoreductase [Actinomyces capricornis]|nr:NAD(P)H-dependent oxidoreductase [Actinomyces capricornis]